MLMRDILILASWNQVERHNLKKYKYPIPTFPKIAVF